MDGAPGDTSLLIKRHYRIVDTSNNAPKFFRTRYGIAQSMDRLREIMDDETMTFPMRAAFLQDRYRAIWKDMHVQNWTVNCASSYSDITLDLSGNHTIIITQSLQIEASSNAFCDIMFVLLKDEFRVMVLEEIARFMILADYFCHVMSEKVDAANEGSIFADKYDSELGILLLNQVLVTLMDLYQRLSHVNRPCPNESEFRFVSEELEACSV